MGFEPIIQTHILQVVQTITTTGTPGSREPTVVDFVLSNQPEALFPCTPCQNLICPHTRPGAAR